MEKIDCTINDGDMLIKYELFLMNRKSLQIAVYPDKSIKVKAPLSSSLEIIEEKIRKKARWIKKQVAFFSQFYPRTPERRYVGGETHLYLGRQYRLKIQDASQNKVLLKNGYFYIDTLSRERAIIQKNMKSWYRKRAKICFQNILDECWSTFKREGLMKPTLKIKKMNKRWGSLSSKGNMNLNLNLIKTSKICIEYVVFHELCHLIHHNHSPAFYKLMDCILWDWKERKHRLEMSLI